LTLVNGALQAIVDDPGVDCVALINASIQGELALKIAGEIVAGAQRTDKPVFVTWGAREAVAPEAYALLDNARIPYYKSPVRCGRALAVLSSYAEARRHAENLDTTNRPSPLGRAVGGEG
jgi:acyl-CoA synthetase (NDP forming)